MLSLEHKVYLGLGSNLGDRLANLFFAIELLPGRVERISSIYESKPWGFDHQPLFLNLVLRLETLLSPSNLLSGAKTIEKMRGRKPGFRNGPRPIDIDILFYDEETIVTENLILPHPRIEERAFVLLPLCEIAPDLIHPTRKKNIQELTTKVNKEGVWVWHMK